jgi:UDP-GlcNAc3NAcA epimerase
MILTLIGARPQFIKAAAVSQAFIEKGIEEVIVHTGQHYDERMSAIFWNELGIPKPQYNLEVGSGSHAVQTAHIMMRFEEVLQQLPKKPTGVLLYGDTNSTIAGALVAAKLHLPVIHIEAGLRSFNKKMPEEVNRIVTDQLSNLLFCPTVSSKEQLAKEGIVKDVHVSGDVMYDCFINFTELAKKAAAIPELENLTDFVLLTIHRPSNTDDPVVFTQIMQELEALDKKIIWPVHPRNKTSIQEFTIPDNVVLIEPLSYFQMLRALEKCILVVTDSGGLQKEAYWAKKQCITLREETEWIETLEGNWNQTYFKQRTIKQLADNKPNTNWTPLYGTGTAAKDIVAIIVNKYYH